MSNQYNLSGFGGWQSYSVYGKARGNQAAEKIEAQFNQDTLRYLDEEIINHLHDSIKLREIWQENFNDHFNDFSFITAPAYKAFEGYLFQIAKDLKLPSGNIKFAGTYFDEEQVDKTIDNLIAELSKKSEDKSLSKEEGQHIKDMVSEMKRFLTHYRHTPAHFAGDPIQTFERAQQNIFSMYRIINETTKTLLKSGLLKIKDGVH